MTFPYTPSVVGTIRKNAGIMPKHEIAAALGWPIAQLDRIAAKECIDLRICRIENVPPVIFATRVPVPERRSEHFGVRLRAADAELLRQKAGERFTNPSALLAEVFEGAIARGKVDELVSAAASYRPGDVTS